MPSNIQWVAGKWRFASVPAKHMGWGESVMRMGPEGTIKGVSIVRRAKGGLGIYTTRLARQMEWKGTGVIQYQNGKVSKAMQVYGEHPKMQAVQQRVELRQPHRRRFER